MGESLSRMAGSLLAILQTRLELASVELEEESLRLLSYLLLALVTLFCLFVAVSLGILLVIAIFWDTNRLGAIAALMIFFSIAAVSLGIGMRASYRRKPKLLSSTRDEIGKDISHLSSLLNSRNRTE